MRCEEILQKISEYIDGELDNGECQSIKQHIDTCSFCKKFVKSFTRNIDLCKELLKVDMPEEVREKLRQKLQNEYGNHVE